MCLLRGSPPGRCLLRGSPPGRWLLQALGAVSSGVHPLGAVSSRVHPLGAVSSRVHRPGTSLEETALISGAAVIRPDRGGAPVTLLNVQLCGDTESIRGGSLIQSALMYSSLYGN